MRRGNLFHAAALYQPAVVYTNEAASQSAALVSIAVHRATPAGRREGERVGIERWTRLGLLLLLPLSVSPALPSFPRCFMHEDACTRAKASQNGK
jgi:hypothetical protein